MLLVSLNELKNIHSFNLIFQTSKSWYLFKNVRINTIYFFIGSTLSFHKGNSRWIAVENKLGLLVVLASLKDAAPFAEQTISDVTILDVSGI